MILIEKWIYSVNSCFHCVLYDNSKWEIENEIGQHIKIYFSTNEAKCVWYKQCFFLIICLQFSRYLKSSFRRGFFWPIPFVYRCTDLFRQSLSSRLSFIWSVYSAITYCKSALLGKRPAHKLRKHLSHKNDNLKWMLTQRFAIAARSFQDKYGRIFLPLAFEIN